MPHVSFCRLPFLEFVFADQKKSIMEGNKHFFLKRKVVQGLQGRSVTDLSAVVQSRTENFIPPLI